MTGDYAKALIKHNDCIGSLYNVMFCVGKSTPKPRVAPKTDRLDSDELLMKVDYVCDVLLALIR